MNDIRALNWRFLVPEEPDSLLFLPIGGEAMPGATIPSGDGGLAAAFRRGPYPAVAAPDLAAWVRDVHAGSAARLLGRLADAVSPGGWLYAGFPNGLYPGRPMASESLRLGTAAKILRRRGFTQARAFLPFPDQRCPAYLISADTRGPLGHFLARLAFPYSAERHDAEQRQRRITWMRRVALASPHSIRVLFAPAVAVFARRPG
jgi:hypothetical protein